MRQHPGEGVLRLIAAFKFFKAIVLAVAGLAALELINPGVAEQVRAWAETLAPVSNNEAVARAVTDVTGLSAQRLEVLGIIAFLYVALFITEGTGLWLGRRWAESLTVVATSLLIPVEIYQLVRRVTLARTATLAVNIAVVVYLIYRLRRDRADSATDSRPHPA